MNNVASYKRANRWGKPSGPISIMSTSKPSNSKLTFTRTVHPIQFKNLSGREFERMVFATLLRMRAWRSLNWHGQTGGDKGRDIIGVCEDEYGNEATVVVACANWQKFTLAKAKKDIGRLTSTQATPPHEVIVIAGGDVSAETKDKCEVYADSKKIKICQVWSGSEFEEHLRFHAPSVLNRFFNGDELPDDETQLHQFILELDPATEKEAGLLVARLFNRPAFQTPIHGESSMPAFRQAIADTIGALNTGIWRDREGAIISRVPRSDAFPDTRVSTGLASCSRKLNELRMTLDEGIKANAIRPCECKNPLCRTHIIDPPYDQRLEQERGDALRQASDALALLGVQQF
ncbi:restriction endonuclease [Stenotrophomonas rhizophila]